jgi:hypothetical protein
MHKPMEDIEKIPVHFILCTERTGSSLLSLMLNLNPKVVCTSEELFALYFYKKYGNKIRWTEKELRNYIDEFWLMAEQDIDLYFTSKDKFFNALLPYKDKLNYSSLIKLTYLHFIEPKSKEQVELIVDKQIKYLFHLPQICEIFPKAKFVILVRDVRDNVVAKSDRGLNISSNAVFLASLWNYTYANISYLEEQKKNLHFVRYEDLVTHPEKTVKTLCDFLGLDFDPGMLKTEGVFSTYLEQRRSYIDSAKYDRIKKFNDELSLEVNTNKIGVYKKKLDLPTESKLVSLNASLLVKFGYNMKVEPKGLGLSDKCYRFLAFLYRPVLLNFYYHLPLSLKLFIKRLRS